jgi:phosphatidylserine/phosphatidylglycerophosphate/cardiolipin synthase-like enzyme
MPTGEALSIADRSARIAACLFVASLAPYLADPAPVIHYAPAENLEHVDVALIDRAEHEIDMAAYVLTDWPVMQALTRAADRGVKASAPDLAREDIDHQLGELIYVARTLWVLLNHA